MPRALRWGEGLRHSARFADLAIKLEADSIAALEVRGRAYYSLGEHDMAMNHFRSALKFDPEHPSVKDRYRVLKRLDKADKRATEASERGDHAAAVEQWQTAIAVDVSVSTIPSDRVSHHP